MWGLLWFTKTCDKLLKWVTDEVSHQEELIKELGNMQNKHYGDSLAPCNGREGNQSSLGALHNSGQKCSYPQGRCAVLTVIKWTGEQCSWIMCKEKSCRCASCGWKNAALGLRLGSQSCLLNLDKLVFISIRFFSRCNVRLRVPLILQEHYEDYRNWYV